MSLFTYLAHVEGEAEEDQVQGASLHQHAGVLDGGTDRLYLLTMVEYSKPW